ncbi:MAG: PHP domain-containing protein, partial [Chloroflexota bacterium]
MKLSTHGLQISSKAAVDLQLHTTLSDGEWEDESLIDYLMEKGFALAAITDHDRVDTTSRLQTLARTKGFPLLVAVEMSAKWKGQLTDLLCFGFDPQNNALASLTEDLADRQRENSRQVFAHLLDQGYDLNAQDLEEVL